MFDQNIGQQCCNQDCRIRDYLPMICSKDCKKAFCKDCFKDHQCNEYVDIKPKVTQKSQPIPIPRKKEICIYNGCTTSVNGPMSILCSYCKNKICITHRHAHYETCENKKVNNAPKTVKSAVAKSWIKRSTGWKK